MEKKICSKCKVEKSVCEFNSRKNRKSKYTSQCKLCICETAKKYRENNSDLIKSRKKDYYDKNREKLNKKVREWYGKNSERTLQQKRDYYQENRELMLERSKLWVKNNRDKVNKYIKTKKEENPLFRVELNIRSRIKQYLKQKNITQKNRTFDIIGIEVNELKKHLESKFVDGMSWDNYGLHGWHIDHIIPLCSAKDEYELLELFYYTNLQPLWAEDNLKKNGKILL
jgi:hypothetical protein